MLDIVFMHEGNSFCWLSIAGSIDALLRVTLSGSLYYFFQKGWRGYIGWSNFNVCNLKLILCNRLLSVRSYCYSQKKQTKKTFRSRGHFFEVQRRQKLKSLFNPYVVLQLSLLVLSFDVLFYTLNGLPASCYHRVLARKSHNICPDNDWSASSWPNPDTYSDHLDILYDDSESKIHLAH